MDKYVLTEEGMYEIYQSYQTLLETMERHVDRKNIPAIKDEEIMKFKKKHPNAKQMHVDRILYGQPQGMSPRLYAPMSDIKARMRDWGMLSANGRPRASGIAFKYHDISIINWFREKANGILQFYRPANNFHQVKKIVDYHMR